MTRISRLNILHQSIEGARIDPGQPHRVGTALAVGQHQFLQPHDKIIAGAALDNVHGPAHRAIGARLWFLFGEQCSIIGVVTSSPTSSCAQCLDAVFQQMRKRGHQARHAFHFAVGAASACRRHRRRRSSSAFPASCAANRVACTHVHRQRFRQRAEAAWLFLRHSPRTSNGWLLPFEVCETKITKLPSGCFTTCETQPSLPPGSLGRPGQRSEASAGFGRIFQHDAPILIEHQNPAAALLSLPEYFLV